MTMHTAGTALVLAGGGVAGVAWELGVLRGIADADPALADRILAADLVVGTSAGASVAVQITSGVPLDERYAAQLHPDSAGIEGDVGMGKLFAEFGAGLAGASGAAGARPPPGAPAPAPAAGESARPPGAV